MQNWPPVSYIVAVERKLISQDTIVKVMSFSDVQSARPANNKMRITRKNFTSVFYHTRIFLTVCEKKY